MKSHPNPVRGASALFLFFLTALFAAAQPSGGPYGPLQQRYEIPADAKHVYYVAPDGKAEAAGTSLEQPSTLEAIIPRVVTGDAIILRGGVYRTGGLKVNQGITLQPYADERPVLKGTLVASKWEAQPNKLWRTTWDRLFPQKPADWWRRQRHGKETPLYRFNNDMVFVDGKLLHAVGYEDAVDENTYYIDYEARQVYIGADPTNRTVEITAWDSALVRTIRDVHGKASDKKGYTMRGLAFTQYAYRALEVEATEPERLADPATFGKEVVGTTIENVSLTFCSRVGAYLRGDNLVFRNCLISDTRTEGLYVIDSADILIERSIFARNNIENWQGYYPSAVKIFNQSYRSLVRDNLVIDQPNSNGVWWDVGNVDARFVDNWVENCGDGFFFEISKGAVCAGNVFVNCDKGVRSLNSSNVQVYNNTFVNSVASFERNERSAVGDHFGWHPSTGPDVNERVGHVFVNNLCFSDETFKKPLLRFEQPAALCGKVTTPHVQQLDSNVYVRAGSPESGPLIVWSPVSNDKCSADVATLEAFRKLAPQFENNSREFQSYYGALFSGVHLKNYQLAPQFILKRNAPNVPADVLKLLGWKSATTPGAYQ
jgi:Right handed beta helix region